MVSFKRIMDNFMRLTRRKMWWLVVAAVLAGYYYVSIHLVELATGLFQSGPLVNPTVKVGARDEGVNLSWHAPIPSKINSLSSAANGTGTYGFVFDSSGLPDGVPYGTYNWCNMPHVRASEYPKVNDSYVLIYVEVIHRHHKRTPYAANTFPVESYPWYCDDEALFLYGAPLPTQSTNKSTNTYWKVYSSPTNPLQPQGFQGTCQFPQITRGGLDDSWQHGHDLYQVYHHLLNFLPEKYDPELVSFRVTNNVITSQVASMVISGMFGRSQQQNFPLLIQPPSIDGLEPGYSCPAAKQTFSSYGPGSKDPGWTAHIKAAAGLFAELDSISGVLPHDEGFHMSLDHYFDNLSARLCHAKPLPCNIKNSSSCVSQEMADKVFRLGEYEYSYLYRDAGSRTLEYSVAKYGVWIAELAQNLRDAMIGQDATSPTTGNASGDMASGGDGGMRYRHNVAHDGSISCVLSILQVEQMVWPGMGSEVIFELYMKKDDGKYHARVLWGGQVLKSSNPSLGALDMVEVEVLLAYFDGLVGQGAKSVPGLCKL